MADVKWIKITTDIFDDEKILLIESLPSADSIITIWFKLLVLAGKQNNSGVFMMNDKIAYTDEMLATIFRRDINTVRLALSTFEKFGMIEMVDDVITIPNWGKHQNIDSIERKKNYQKNYMREYRKKQALLAESSNCKTNSKSNVSRTDKEIEEEIEKDIEKDNKDIVGKKPTPPYKAIIDYLNEKTNSRYKHTTKSTQRIINGRFDDGFTLEDFKIVIDVKSSQWLGDKKMAAYLRPETLFAASHFESYLNECRLVKPQEPKHSGISEKLARETSDNLLNTDDCGEFE